MTEKIQTNIIEPKLIDETYSINKSENNENKISLIRPCLESPKEKKGLFTKVIDRILEMDSKDIIDVLKIGTSLALIGLGYKAVSSGKNVNISIGHASLSITNN